MPKSFKHIHARQYSHTLSKVNAALEYLINGGETNTKPLAEAIGAPRSTSNAYIRRLKNLHRIDENWAVIDPTPVGENDDIRYPYGKYKSTAKAKAKAKAKKITVEPILPKPIHVPLQNFEIKSKQESSIGITMTPEQLASFVRALMEENV